MTAMRVEWSPNDIDVLTNLWSTHSGSVIGSMIGKSRNAVIGKAYRMGLTNKKPQRELTQSERRPRPRKRPSGNCRSFFPKVAKLPPITPILAPPRNLSILDLGWGDCRAIVGRGEDGLALYCGVAQRERMVVGEDGEAKVEQSSFCPGHAHIYYRPFTRC